MLTTTAPRPLAADVETPRSRLPGRLLAYGLLMGLSFAAYALGHLLGDAGGVFGAVLNMVGAGACGWAWLIARALFDPARHDVRWPRIVVFIVAVSGTLSVLALPGGGSTVEGVVDNTYALSGSAALLLTFFEPFHRYQRDLPLAEKRFRFAFVAVYALLVSVSILAPGAPEATPAEAYRLDLLKSVCALGGLAAGAAAIWFRVRHPLPCLDQGRAARRAPTPDDRYLADRILHLLDTEDIHTEPNLKVADIAHRLGQPEYRVSQCIPAALGFDNFNRLINHHRVERAKRLLLDSDARRSILDIAFECGFGSVGPFNRAFKTETGLTPRAFRTAHAGT